jgi:boron transporter
MVRTAKEGMMNNDTSSEVYGKMHEVFIKMDDGKNVCGYKNELDLLF